MNHQDALAQLARETARARARIALERALRAGLALLLAMGAWAALALIGAHERLPLLAQSLSALAALALFGWLGWRALAAWRAPSLEEARARLAKDSALDQATFDALEDHPARYDAFAIALWRREHERALADAARVRAGPPRPRLDEIDRHRLRYVLIAALLVTAGLAGAAGPDRLARAFLPDPGPLLGDQAMRVEAWVSAAAYTGAAPVSLSERLGETIETPPSIEAHVRLTGPTGAPLLVYSGEGGRARARFVRAADGAWEARLPIPGAGRLSIVRFHTRGFWRLIPARDARPRVAFAAPIVAAPRERAIIAWRASDDYGVRRLMLRVRPVNPPPGLARADAIDTVLELPAGDPNRAEGESTIEIAAHPYAGMQVEARLVAVDALGQQGVSEAQRFTMPEQVFLQPLARAAIEIRRHILAERRAYAPAPAPRFRLLPDGLEPVALLQERRAPLARAPEGMRRAARLLDALTMAPEDGYFRDIAVFLGFRYARAQLDVAESLAAADGAADTLWRTALRAEFGGAADARRALEEAQRALAQALSEGAPGERIRQLLEALRRATEDYMQALTHEAMRLGERQNLEDTEDEVELTAADIEDLLRQVERLAAQGRHEEARQMLDLLAHILANMDVRLSESGEGGEAAQNEQMQQSMDTLSEAIGDQRQLNDETRQQQQQRQQQAQAGGGGDQQGGEGGAQMAERQAQIRQGLAEAQRMAEDAGAAPQPSLDGAGQAMARAEQALRRGDLDAAQAAQAAALDQLREGAEVLAAEMRARGREGGRGQNESGGPRDPLGRAIGGNDGRGDDGRAAGADPVRARDIFDDIRRRAQDASRPEAEREYLRRLLDRFGADS